MSNVNLKLSESMQATEQQTKEDKILIHFLFHTISKFHIIVEIYSNASAGKYHQHMLKCGFGAHNKLGTKAIDSFVCLVISMCL